MPSIWFKMSNSKIPHLKFWRFFRQSMTKITGKTDIWTILCFPPLPPLNNVEEQWSKLASSNVASLQYCIGGEGGILNTLFKIPIIFCQWLWVVPRLTQYFILLRLIKWASETPGNWMGKSKLSPRSGWVTPLIKRSHDVFF